MPKFLGAARSGWDRRSWKEDFLSKSETAIDPYVLWADLADFWSRDNAWAPVILEVTGPASKFAADFASQPWIRIPDVYRQPSPSLATATFCTATMTWNALRELGRDPLRGRIKRFEVGTPDYDAEDAMYAKRGGRVKRGSPPARTVVVGIIDDGLAFAHERFRDADGRSRVEYFWNQDGKTGMTPDFGYGAELGKPDVDRLLKTAAGDEDRIYREAGQRFVGRRATHGTVVMDLACGEDPRALPKKAPCIIGVQLPRETTRDTSGRPFAVHALDGLRYILDRAGRVARGAGNAPAPVVVNMSYGKVAGPHDGSSLLEAAIEELIHLHGNLSVVVPAGNFHLSRCHASLALAAEQERTLSWRIQPEDTTPSFLELWLGPGEDPSGVEIEVTTPTGDASGPIRREMASEERKNLVYSWTQNDVVLAAVVWLDRVATGGGRMILVAVAPTVRAPGVPPDPRGSAPSGTWSVRVKASGSRANVEAWIQRDDTPFGFPRRGRQSRFDDPAYERFDRLGQPQEADNAASYIKRAKTINAIGTGGSVVVVGGYRESDGAPAPYSSPGPTMNPDLRVGPDAMAVSDRSRVRHGVLAAGARSGSVVAMDGTSVAAPQVTRWIAERMIKSLAADRAAVVAFASEADPDPTSPAPPNIGTGWQPKPPPSRGGGGRIPSVPRPRAEVHRRRSAGRAAPVKPRKRQPPRRATRATRSPRRP